MKLDFDKLDNRMRLALKQKCLIEKASPRWPGEYERQEADKRISDSELKEWFDGYDGEFSEDDLWPEDTKLVESGVFRSLSEDEQMEALELLSQACSDLDAYACDRGFSSSADADDPKAFLLKVGYFKRVWDGKDRT